MLVCILKLFALLSTCYEGAEVETDINVLDGDICLRTSLCGHNVLAEDVPAKDVPVEDMMSTQILYVLAEDVMSLCGHYVLNIRSTQGCPQRGRPRQGHLCPFLLLPLRNMLSNHMCNV